MNKICLFLFSLFLFFNNSFYGQSNDSIVNKLVNHVRSVNDFTQYVPQEKVYLHFDNNCYYQGDNIWFKCYVVTSKLHEATSLSKTLYVDLLNPGGEIIEKKVLEIKDGQCSGEFTLNKPMFYSGFYEVRAYTKYMLNFGEDAIFSRVFPVYDAPKPEGNYSERVMGKTFKDYPMKRKKPHKNAAVNVTFFPEGGNLINGVESRIAFQATDEVGNPIDIAGIIEDNKGEEISRFSTMHDGRGVFSYTPISTRKAKAVIIYNKKTYLTDLPQALSQGYVMKVDNLSQSDSIDISIDKNDDTPADILGVVTLCRGDVQSFNIVDSGLGKEIRFKIPKKDILSGINQIILFDKSGKILCDRLVFVNRENYLTITKTQDKSVYNPFELVSMEFTVTDEKNNPANTSFSLSVKDAANEVFYTDNIQANLLLSSEIKGYIHNPSYYFEADDAVHRQALDLLLMVQGWRRYLWKHMAGLEPFEIKHIPEQGVEIRGQVRSPVKKKNKPNMDVSLMLTRTDENDETVSELMYAKTDSLGQFKLISGLYGKWDIALGVSEKGKKKNEKITLDRLFRPEPKTYISPELQVSFAIEADGKDVKRLQDDESDADTFIPYSDDSLELRMDQKMHHLGEVVITEKAVGDNYRANSVAYYDVFTEVNDIIDNGGFVGEDIYEFLVSVSPAFFREIRGGEFVYTYKGRKFLIVKDRYHHAANASSDMDRSFDVLDFESSERIDLAKITRLTAIKSMYVNEDYNLIHRFMPSKSIHDIQREYSGIVFIETYPESKVPNNARGIRKVALEGYSPEKEFYSPDYSILPKEADYRRTLYWNPTVKTDEEGKAKIQFYNNSTCKNMIISAETITPEGIPGVYKP